MRTPALAVTLLLTAGLLTACHEAPPQGQGKTRSEGEQGDLVKQETAKDGMRRLISAIANDDDRLAHNPPQSERNLVESHRRQAVTNACDLHTQVDTHNRDVDLNAWAANNC